LAAHVGGDLLNVRFRRISLTPPSHHPSRAPTSEEHTAMTDLMTGLNEVKAKTSEALRASEADGGASVVLVAVVREFDSKADKANRQTNSNGAARDAVIELEQAGDSAKAAAEADPGLGEAAREAVLDAHLAICILKTTI
jgi:hypothetical protein